MEKIISYVYKYDRDNDVYKIRLVDGKSLDGFIPDGLFQEIVMSTTFNTGGVILITDVQKTKYFSADGTQAFIDLNERDFSPIEIEEIFNTNGIINISVEESNKKQSGLKKVLSRFKKNNFRWKKTDF